MGNFKYVKHEGTNKKEASSTLYFICSSVKFFQKDNLKNVFLLMFQSSLNSLFTWWGKMFYHSPLFAFLQILKLSVFAYIDHYTVLVACFCKDQKGRNSASSFSITEWLYTGVLLYLEAAATENSGQKEDSRNFVVAFNTRFSYFLLDKKVTTAPSSSMQNSSVFPLDVSLSIMQYHQ